MDFLDATWPKVLGAIGIFLVISAAVPVGWDALGMGFLKLRFKLWHIWLAVLGGVALVLRGKSRELNMTLIRFGCAMMLGLLAACYLLACAVAWLAQRL